MARQKQHHDIGKYVAVFEHQEVDAVPGMPSGPVTYDTPEEALAAQASDGLDDGDVIYVYAVVGVKVVRKPTLTENYVE